MKLSFFFYRLSLALLIFGLYSPLTFAESAMLAPKAKESLLLDVQKLSNDTLVAVGERGHILKSDDLAKSWQQQTVPTQSNLTALDFFNDEIGIAVGFQQTILLTKDGGKSWTLVYSDKGSVEYPALFDVKFIDAKRVIAIGAFGLYLESNDGGESWQDREIVALGDFYGGFSHFYGLAQDNRNGHIYLAGEKFVATETEDGEEISTGLIAVSKDKGQAWTKITSPYDGSFFGIKVAPNNSIFVYGLKGNIFSTKDSGASWESVDLKTNSGIHDMVFLGNDFYVVGTGGFLSNKNAQLVDTRDDLKGRAALVPLNDDELLIVGEKGVETLTISSQVQEVN